MTKNNPDILGHVHAAHKAATSGGHKSPSPLGKSPPSTGAAPAKHAIPPQFAKYQAARAAHKVAATPQPAKKVAQPQIAPGIAKAPPMAAPHTMAPVAGPSGPAPNPDAANLAKNLATAFGKKVP